MSDRLKLLRKGASRHTEPVGIQLDGRVRVQIEAVEDQLDRLESSNDVRQSGSGSRRKLVETLEKLHESARETTLWVWLEALQRTPYRAIVDAHPPRKLPDGKTDPRDLFGANMDTLPIPLIKACIIGHTDTDDLAAEPQPFPPDLVDGKPNTDEVTVGWLLGFTYKDGDEAVVVEPFLTDRQIEKLYSVAFKLNRGDDAAPLPRKRSASVRSDAG